jgi:nitrite reductase/ring-hydroxylating ferredoxin subunit
VSAPRIERAVCPSEDLAEASLGVRFPIDAATNGFAIRFLGQVRAYVNRCPHLGTELDWQPGDFFEESGLYLVCSTHGAIFEPDTGKCVAGPCRGASLEPMQVREREGQVFVELTGPAIQHEKKPR